MKVLNIDSINDFTADSKEKLQEDGASLKNYEIDYNYQIYILVNNED